MVVLARMYIYIYIYIYIIYIHIIQSVHSFACFLAVPSFPIHSITDTFICKLTKF